MRYPAFFEDVSKIVLRDPLADFLGAAEGGLVEYAYVDAVKLAGHSCPTVAGAYLLCLKALTRLYGGQPPERGAIRVDLRDGLAHGVTGVMANVMGLITGAAQDGGCAATQCHGKGSGQNAGKAGSLCRLSHGDVS